MWNWFYSPPLGYKVRNEMEMEKGVGESERGVKRIFCDPSYVRWFPTWPRSTPLFPSSPLESLLMTHLLCL